MNERRECRVLSAERRCQVRRFQTTSHGQLSCSATASGACASRNAKGAKQCESKKVRTRSADDTLGSAGSVGSVLLRLVDECECARALSRRASRRVRRATAPHSKKTTRISIAWKSLFAKRSASGSLPSVSILRTARWKRVTSSRSSIRTD